MLAWEDGAQQDEDFNAGVSGRFEATAEYFASRASEESSPMPQSKLWLLLRRLDEMHV